VTTTTFTIQTVFQEEVVVRRCRNKPKVAQWFDKVIKVANSLYKLNKNKEVVKDKKKRKK